MNKRNLKVGKDFHLNFKCQLPIFSVKEADDPSVAQTKPAAIALSGKGGLSAASPIATSITGDGGIAVSAPQATSIAGDFPIEEEQIVKQ